MTDNNDRQQKLSAARKALLEKRRRAKLKQSSDYDQAMTIPSRPDDAPRLASFGQERLWYLQQLNPHDTAYNMITVLRIQGMLDVSALSDAMTSVVGRHEVLRISFAQDDGVLLQNVQEVDTLPLSLNIHERTNQPLDEQIKSITNQPFDLEHGPLIRTDIIREADEKHILVIVLHHIIADEWSMDVFLRDLFVAYNAYLEQESPSLSPLPIQYSDFAWWQQRQMQDGHFDSQLDYWRQQLQGDLPLIQLPTDFSRPHIQQHLGGFVKHRLPKHLSESIISLSKTSNTTLFVTMLAAFQAFLHRYSGQDDILVGTPVTNREHKQTENLIGFFLNTVVFRSDFSTAVNFEKLVEATRQQSLTVLSNNSIPFERIVQDINPKRDPSYSPIFQVMFVHQNTADLELPTVGLEFEHITIDAGISKFDLTLFVKSVDDYIHVSLEYDTALYTPQTAQRLLIHFETFLDSLVAEPARDIATLNMLPDAERRLILDEWAQTQIDFPKNDCIHHLIQAHPPDKTAVSFDGRMLSYGELNQRANQLANFLLQHVEHGSFVGLCVERSFEMIVGILGILKAGCAYVPIDPSYPTERINYILDDAQITLLLTQDHLLSSLDNPDIHWVSLDRTEQFVDLPATPPNLEISPDNFAYMIYTSGSTGRPKGVRVTHRNLVHSTTARFEYYPHQAETFLLLSSFAFDSSVTGIFWSLAQGGTLCLPRQYAERDVIQLAQLIEEQHVTHMLLLPALYQLLLEFVQPKQLQSLNTIMVAGEACPLTLPSQHYRMLPDATLYNEYGPTEATVWSTVWEIPSNPSKMLIGKPIPNMQTYILDTQMNPVPIGVVGELFLGGQGITQGYHNRQELTAERFIANPFGADRLYRTGDLARYQPDGTIEFLGRIDNQVKVNGHRIELSEIENTLNAQPHIDEAAVILVNREDSSDSYVNPTLEQLLSVLKANPDAGQLLDEIESLSEEAVNAMLKQVN